MTKKSIYKIENMINHKIYIGQSNDPIRRFKEHCWQVNTNYTSLINLAIRKWGKENFSFQIIEDNIENYDEREIFWIKYYNSKAPFGYNIASGGNKPPVYFGEDNFSSTHTIEQIKEVKRLLKETDKDFNEIAKLTGYSSVSSIKRINNGKLWKDENAVYPIRKTLRSKEICEERWEEIVFYLQNTDLPQKEIAKKCGVKRSCVTMINNGKNGQKYNKKGLEYPIRKGRHYSTNL